MSILAFFSAGLLPSPLTGGGDDRFSVGADGMGGGAAATEAAVDVGFLRPFREGGGGASSVRPWERNFD